jgi:hypothetical protein
MNIIIAFLLRHKHKLWIALGVIVYYAVQIYIWEYPEMCNKKPTPISQEIRRALEY